MSPICSTRALKNAKRIRALAPHIIPAKEPAAGYSSIVPFSILARIHKMSDQELATTLSSRPELFQVAKKLRRPPASALPTATLRTGPGRPRSALFGDPPFKGTLHFVQLTLFVQANNSTHSVSSADIETAIQYTNLAVKPLSAYCSQYGANRISVSQNILQFGQSIVGGRYNDDDVQHWVNQIISDNRLAKDSSCIIILNPREMVNTDANLGHHILGYHDKSDAPYIFVNVLGKGLTVQDKSNFYADTLSHEIAEMVCDPDVSWFNHEVCDGCAGNCANDWRNFFTDPSPSVADSYIGSAKGSDFPPKFPFTFFIASIARPSHADDCPAPENACAYEPPRPDGNDLASDLLSYGDAGTPGNVSSPMVVGFGGWLDFKFLFAGRNATGQDRIYAVDQSDRLLSYGDAGTPGNVSSPVVVGVGGWLDFKFLFAGRNVAGEDRIYAVDQNDQLLSYGDAGTPGNVSSPVVVGVGGWLDFKFLFAGRNVAGEDRIYAVDQNDQLLSYGDAGTPGNVSGPVVVGVGGWLDFKFLFAGRNIAGEDRIYAVDQNDQLLSYGDAGTPGNVSSPVVVGVGGWLDFKLLFAGRNLADQDRIYAVVA